MNGERARRLHVSLGRAVAASGIFRLGLGRVTLGGCLERAYSAATKVAYWCLSRWWDTPFVNALRAIVPPTPLRLLALQSYEPETTQVLRRLLRPGMTVVDLGAHIGYYSVLAAMEVGPSGHVYAFEPDPFTLPLLRRNVQACGYEGVVTVVPKAVSNTAGKTELFLGRGSGITSIYRARDSRRGPVVVERGTATVETISLNAYFAELGWPPVDLVKMDIEGAERVALEGMLELARRNPRLRLIVEFCPQHIKDAGATPEELFKSLRRVGFARIWVASDRLKPVHVPQDLPWLIKLGDESTVNLLCEKEEA